MRWPHGDPNAVVRAVLAQPAYRSAPHGSEPPAQVTLLGAFWHWLVQHVLGPLFHPFARALGASRGAGTAIGVVLVGLALLGLGFVAFRFALALARPSRAARGTRKTGAGRDLPRAAAHWLEAARQAGARAEYGRAIAALFSAALATLDERALVAYDAARTPGEYRRLVRRQRSAAAAPFDELSERFAQAAFAPDPPGRTDFENAQRAYAAFEPVTRP